MLNTSIRETLAKRYAQGERDFRDLCDYLQGVDLSNMTLERCNFAGANLTAANMANANLKGANISSAILNSANMDKAVLNGANLRNTQFQQASLIDCDLKFSFLSKSNFAGAILKGSQLDTSVLIQAQYDEKTVFPEGFVFVGKGMVKVLERSPKENCQQSRIQNQDSINALNSSRSTTFSKIALNDIKVLLENPRKIDTEGQFKSPNSIKEKRIISFRGRTVEI